MKYLFFNDILVILSFFGFLTMWHMLFTNNTMLEAFITCFFTSLFYGFLIIVLNMWLYRNKE